MLVHSTKELASAISSQRKKLKLSQADLGDLVGLKQKTISALENKPENMRITSLLRVLAALNLQVELSDQKQKADKAKWQEEW